MDQVGKNRKGRKLNDLKYTKLGVKQRECADIRFKAEKLLRALRIKAVHNLGYTVLFFRFSGIKQRQKEKQT